MQIIVRLHEERERNAACAFSTRPPNSTGGIERRFATNPISATAASEIVKHPESELTNPTTHSRFQHWITTRKHLANDTVRADMFKNRAGEQVAL